MLKALVFLSVIVSFAYSAPYGGYGGSSHDSGLGSVIHTEGMGLGEVHHGITERVVPLGTSSFIGSTVGVGSPLGISAPVIERNVLGSSSSDSYGSHQEVVTQAPLIVHEVVTQAAYSAPAVFHEAPAAYSAPVEVVTQAPLIVHEVVTQAAYSAPAIVHEAPSYGSSAPALSIARVETPVLRMSSGY